MKGDGYESKPEEGERLLHEEALVGGGFGFAGGRLFLYLSETKFKHLSC